MLKFRLQIIILCQESLLSFFALRYFRAKFKYFIQVLDYKQALMLTKKSHFLNGRVSAGFSLIELLVVIAIIGILSNVVLTSVSGARVKAKIAVAQSDMDQIRTAMTLYMDGHSQLPPEGNNCSSCSDPCDSSWTDVVDALEADGYMTTRIDADPWGHYYCYDDNYRIPDCSLDSPIWSMGPNGIRDTVWPNGPPTTFAGDDFGFIIEAPQC
jgi:type II secretion system protein G